MTDAPAIAPDLPAQVWTGRKRRGGLFVTDAELIERLGVPEKIGRQALHTLDSDPRLGFPKKHKFWGDRRYLPAIQAYLDKHYGFSVISPTSKREGLHHDR